MGEPFDLLAEAICVERLDRADDPRMKLAAALLQQAAVRDLVRERVLEGVLEIRKQPRLVDELGSLQAVEPAAERLVRQIGDRLEQRERHVLADDGGDLQQVFVFRREPVDARRQHHLDRGRDLDRLDRLRQPILARSPASAFVSTSVRTVSSRKNGLPRLTRSCLSGASAGIVAEERIQQLSGALGRERVQPHLAVGRLARPRRAGTRAGSSRAAAGAPTPGSRPGCRAAPASRRRSSGDPRRSGGAAARGLPAAAGASRRRACAGAAGPGRASATRASSTGTSSRASNAGSVGSSARSSASSLPVTFSRISRRSSRSWISK